ncbi:MAG: DAK2 domain-containing protein [Chloroflexi bacterium]|nr:DAK2 domain-containing protein [Chloroflexota bacterium]
MERADTINGQALREMFSAATVWLEKSASDIDALNVFPVPDGDTGTNMLLTMRSGIEEAYRAPDQSMSAVAQAMAKGTLIGARGNSGVILSQIWRGIAQAVVGKDSITAIELADALIQASKMAYRGLSSPVEGTMLTVIKDVASAAHVQATAEDSDPVSVIEAAVNAAAESVANTPNLLKVLKEAGVVDAGGQGLYTILEGALQYLRGEAEQMQYRRPHIIASSSPAAAKLPQAMIADEVPFGYCTEFMLEGKVLDPERLRQRLAKKGESLIVVGDGGMARIHIHTTDPGTVLHYATSLGTLHQVSVRNMDEQHHDFLEMQKERMPSVDTAIVAVVSGDGLSEVFRSLGVAVVVPGGQTMNPSTKDLLRAIESVASDKVVLLTNNGNVVLAAEQTCSLTSKRVEVIPTKTIPQGVAAILAFDYEADFDTNVQLMNKAKSTVKSIEITRAVRSTQLGGLKIRRKQAIAFLDGDLVAVADDHIEVLHSVLARLDMKHAEVVTVYYGADTEQAEAEQVGDSIRERYPQLQIEVVRGGHPHYNYIVSVE